MVFLKSKSKEKRYLKADRIIAQCKEKVNWIDLFSLYVLFSQCWSCDNTLENCSFYYVLFTCIYARIIHETTKVNPSKTMWLTHYSGQLFVPTLKAIQHSTNTYPICDSPLWPSQKSRRNHRSYVWTEALSSMVFAPAHVWTKPKTFIIKQTTSWRNLFSAKTKAKSPWDLYWENKTYKLKRSIGHCHVQAIGV